MEYRPAAKGGQVAAQRRLEAMSSLQANVLEVFDENGVQIMSPHACRRTTAATRRNRSG